MSSALADSVALHERVRRFGRATLEGQALEGQAAEKRAAGETFDELALDIARFQVEHNPALARLARRHSLRLEHWRDVPAVPADAFRLGRIAVHPSVDDVAEFQTSGTTGGAGRHAFRTLDTYRELSLGWAWRALSGSTAPPGRRTVLGLAQPFEPLRRSSLGYMMQELMRELDGRALADDGAFDALERGRWLVGAGGVDLIGLRQGLAAAERRGEPVWLLATSFALAWLLDALGENRVTLPEGSRVMQTGGFKGYARTLDDLTLTRALERALGVPAARIIGEYGMTELSSQLYDGGFRQGLAGESVFVEPAWLRVTPVDPVSLEPVAEGETGLAQFTDLANIDSAMKVLTQDCVRRVPGGIVLYGRRPSARLRGCSLAVESLIEERRVALAAGTRGEAG